MSATESFHRGLAEHSLALMAHGSLADFRTVVAVDAVNREARSEPPACRLGGPAAWHATAEWLRTAFAELHHDVESAVAQDDLVVLFTTMRGRQDGPFVVFDAAGLVARSWAPTGRPFAVHQTHWFRVSGSLVTEHWASRDDLGMGEQLGWIPPTPRYLARCALAKRAAVREYAALGRRTDAG